MELSIIIVNYNSRDYLHKCLSSILEEEIGMEYEVLVIDSASFDGAGEMVKQQHPDVQFIQSERNLGFAGANNEASKASQGRNLLFLNPDTEIENGAIVKLFDALECMPNAGIVGAKLLNSNRTVQRTCARVFPNILNQALECDLLIRLFPHSGLWCPTPFFWKKESPAEVDAVSGACLMVKRSIFEAVGMFSNDYFMYSEDIDLCYKVRQAGLKSYYVPDAVVVHHGGGSSSKSNINTFSDVLMLESRKRFFNKNRSLLYGLQYRVMIFLTSLVRVSLIICFWPFACLFGKSSAVIGPLRKWTARLRWAFGLEKWAKTHY